jgi:hypothetical protein
MWIRRSLMPVLERCTSIIRVGRFNMIRVNEDYIIEIDNLNYTVKRDHHKKTSRKDLLTGEYVEADYYSNVGFYENLTSAVKGVIADMNKRRLRDGVHTLEEAVAIVLENNNKVAELLEKALEV